MDKAAAIAALQPEKWTASLNESLNIYITDSKGSAASFKPQFTYPIFGEAETVFGYKDLDILLCFDSCTFAPFLNVRWSEKLPNVDVDVLKKMMEFLPQSTVFKDELKWREQIDAELANYKIPGTQVGDIWTNGDEKYALYEIDINSVRGVELLKRLQILVLLFIEAGSFIEHDDPHWRLYVMYQVTDPASPQVVGFTTVYNYWKYPGSEKFDSGILETRKKISQFIILPVYQGKSLGGQMYGKLFEIWRTDTNVLEVVVEDPSEAFDDLRDRVDLTRLLGPGGSIDLETFSIDQVQSPGWFEQFKTTEKLEKRQMQRLLEMIFLYQFQHGSKKESKKAIRLFIKQRLYEKNFDALCDMDQATRNDKLQTAYESLESDYFRVLESVMIGKKRHGSVEETDLKRQRL